MDFGKFKKVSSNQRSTVLQHPDGHKIRVAHEALSPAMRSKLEEQPMHYAEGGEVATPAKQKEPDFIDKAMSWAQGLAPDLLNPVAMQSAQGTASMSPSAAPAMNAVMQQLPTEPKPEETPTNYQMPQTQAPQQGLPTQPVAQGGIQQQMAGLNNQAKVAGQQGSADAAAADAHMQAVQALQQHTEAEYQRINGERDKVLADYQAGHIDPNHYMDAKSGGGKVATAIGLLLGGISGGINGTENPVMKFLQQQIDRDIDSQKSNQGKQKSMVEFYQQQFGNTRDADLMARAHLNDIYASKIAEAAGQAKGPMAQAIAQQQIGVLKQQADALTGQVAQSQAVRAGVQSGQISHEQALPLIVPDKQRGEVAKAIADGRENEQMRAWADENANKLTSMVGKGVFSPNARQSLVDPLAGFIEKIGEGRYNHDAAVNIANGFLPSKTDSDSTIKLKERQRQQFFDGIATKHNSIIQSGGLPPLPSSRRVVNKH